MNDIIILGVNGMLGSMLLFVAEINNINVKPLNRQDFDILVHPIEKLDPYIDNTKHTVIINCIGAIPQKNHTEEEYYNINTNFPQNLSYYCSQRQIELIHISTNCVFSGKKDKCIETDKPDEEELYGRTKYLGEPNYGLVIRCSIIGLEKNTNYGLLEWFLNSSGVINGYIDSIWNGITTFELSNIIFERIKNNQIKNCIEHYYSNQSYSKYELLGHINTIFKQKRKIYPIEKGLKYYTLSSISNLPRKDIIDQLQVLYNIYPEYKKFYSL